MKPVTSLEDRNIKTATKLFGVLLANNGLDKKHIKGWQMKTQLKQLNIPEGWLPHWMLQSDMLASYLWGKRIWDVNYFVNDEAVDHLQVVAPTGENDETYDRFPVADCNQVPGALILLLCQLALHRTITQEGSEVSLNYIDMYLDPNEPVMHGRTLPYPNINGVSSSYASESLQEWSNVISELDLSLESELSLEAD